MTTDSKIDDAIFGYLTTANGNWRKVAMVIAQASDAVRGDFPAGQAEYDLVAKRIVSLVDAGRLLAQGDITKWRYSEVRVP